MAKLVDYPDLDYFSQSTEFTVTVSCQVIIEPSVETRYSYIIGSQMEPIKFSISLNGGTASISSVNGETNELVDFYTQTYGLILTQ